MTTNNEIISNYKRGHLLYGQGPNNELPWKKALRVAGLESFVESGYPSHKDEAWRYSNPKRITSTSWSHSDAESSVTETEIVQHRLEGAVTELVFIDGNFCDDLSRGASIAGITIEPISKNSEVPSDIVPSSGGFASLNDAFFQNGVVINVLENHEIDGIIHLMFVSTDSDSETASHIKNFVTLGEGAAATVVESYVGCNNSFCNTKSHLTLAKGAALEHHILELGSKESHWVGETICNQDRDSAYDSHTFWLGEGWARNNLVVKMNGVEGFCNLSGLYLTDNRQHVDNHTEIDHVAPHCTSRELYKGVVSGKSRVVFNGRVLVRREAQRTDSDQANHNILLTRDAEIDTKPELEIYADDVKCAHGTTIGQLDAQALHYLRVRGIPKAMALEMLTTAFVMEQLDGVEHESLKARYSALISERLTELGKSL